MSDYAISIIRTTVPTLVGAVLAWLGSISIFHPLISGLTTDQKAGVVTAITGILIALYYAIVRAVEQRVPGIGVLLGKVAAVQYTAPSTPAVAPASVDPAPPAA